MISRAHFAAAAAALLGIAPLSAQQPLSLGTAAAVGDAAVTESRRADAVLWNPALVGIYDGPLSSYSLVSVDVGALPAASWLTSASALGLDGWGMARLPRRVAPRGGAGFGDARIRWFATQHRDLAVTLSSGEIVGADVPDAIGEPLGGSAVRAPGTADSAMRSTYSVLAVTRGSHVGRMPVLGSVWVGATAKGWLAHSYSRGGFRGDAPGEDVFRETGIENVPGYAVDVGVLAQPVARVRVGVSASNVVSGAFRPKNGPRVRDVAVLQGATGGYEVVESNGPYLGKGDEDTEGGRLAAALWESVGFPTVVRAGGSLETDAGSFSAAWRATVRDGGLDPEWQAAPFTLAFTGSASMPVRASYAWGSDAKSLGLGVRLGTCERQWVASVVRRTGPWGVSFGFSASLAVGSAAGCDLFRS